MGERHWPKAFRFRGVTGPRISCNRWRWMLRVAGHYYGINWGLFR